MILEEQSCKREFCNLEIGDYFMWNGALYRKSTTDTAIPVDGSYKNIHMEKVLMVEKVKILKIQFAYEP